MGNYASASDLQAECESAEAAAYLTDGAGGVPNVDRLNSMIERAEAVIDSHLARRYRTPIDVVSSPHLAPLMRQITVDIAYYYLAVRGDNLTEARKTNHESREKWLIAAASGKVLLPGAAAATTISLSSVAAWGSADAYTSATDAARVFDAVSMADIY
jgi:phage gp36-like protein